MFDIKNIVTIPHTGHVFHQDSIVGIGDPYFNNPKFGRCIGMTVYGVGFCVVVERSIELPEDMFNRYLEEQFSSSTIHREIQEYGCKMAKEWHEEVVRAVFANKE